MPHDTTNECPCNPCHADACDCAGESAAPSSGPCCCGDACGCGDSCDCPPACGCGG
ncbi:MAG TPA: hypothetical protein VFG69_11025 [Nannocystaceae bacterium]|nr:hypothetical protein [Nannocystaceae bacterium]